MAKFTTMRDMVMGSIDTIMETSILGIGKIIKKMARVNITFRMEMCTRGNSRIIRNMA